MIRAAVLIALADTLLYFVYLIKTKGLDPSLITQSSVLAIKDFWPARIFLGASALGYISYTMMGRVLSYLLITQALLQIFLLIIFGRRYTQPYIYFAVIALGASAALMWGSRLGAFTIVAVTLLVGECYLFWWRKHRKRIYDSWVREVALNITYRFRSAVKSLDEKEWRWVLHAATTEAIARPAIVRLMERAYFIFFLPPYISTGIMQTASSKPLSNDESIRAGSKKVTGILRSMPAGIDGPSQLRWFAKHYNGSFGYANYLYATYPGVEAALKDSSQQ